MAVQVGGCDRPIGNIGITIRQHGGAPNVAQPTERQGRPHIGAVALPGNQRLGFPVGKVRTEKHLERHIPGHIALQRCHVTGRPVGRLASLKLADNPGAVGFEFQSRVEHEHLGAARQQRFGAGDARRAGTDDTMHAFRRFGRIGSHASGRVAGKLIF